MADALGVRGVLLRPSRGVCIYLVSWTRGRVPHDTGFRGASAKPEPLGWGVSVDGGWRPGLTHGWAEQGAEMALP